MTYSLEDTIKFQNPKKTFLQFVYPKKFPINVSSVLLLSVLPTDHNRDKAGRNCVKLT